VALDLVGSSSVVIEINYSGILHCGESRDVEQVAPTSLTILRLCDWLAFDLSNSLFFNLLHKYTRLLLFLQNSLLDHNCAHQFLF